MPETTCPDPAPLRTQCTSISSALLPGLLPVVVAWALSAGCAAPARAEPAQTPLSGELAAEGPYALLLGTAQDAGLPQIGCRADCCEAARADPQRRRRATAVLVVDPASGGRWLLDAGPDLREQVEQMRGHPDSRGSALSAARSNEPRPPVAMTSTRPPLVDAIFLTHAHMGHVAGLLHLGPEAYAARQLPVYGTRSTCEFLGAEAPWSLLVRGGHLAPRPLEPGQPVPLRGPDGLAVDGLRVTAFTVPHRDEFSDTVGFLVEGPRASLAYLPDIDKWARWDRPLEELLNSADIALLDGTFYAAGELPGRDMASIPHPFIVETMARLADQPADVRQRVWFTHLNHGNPAADPDSAAAQAIRDAGMHVAGDGDRFEL